MATFYWLRWGPQVDRAKNHKGTSAGEREAQSTFKHNREFSKTEAERNFSKMSQVTSQWQNRQEDESVWKTDRGNEGRRGVTAATDTDGILTRRDGIKLGKANQECHG